MTMFPSGKPYPSLRTKSVLVSELLGLMLDGDHGKAVTLVHKLNHDERRELVQAFTDCAKLVEDVMAIGMYRQRTQ